MTGFKLFIFLFITLIHFDPLEQFDSFIFLNNSLGITNLHFFFIIIVFFISFFGFNIYNFLKKNNWNVIVFFYSFLINFFTNIILSNITLKKQFLIFLYYFLFLSILFGNCIGLLPYSYTVTSSFFLALSFSSIYFFIITFLAIYNTGFIPFFKIFIPSGTPLIIVPLLVIIEFVSYLARLFSLAIRLFANMMAGHTLLKILINFSFLMLVYNSTIWIFSIIPWFIVFLIFILEILISFLQAYVFIILISIYTNDILTVH